LCALYGREANPTWLPIWFEALESLSPVLVRHGFAEIEKNFVPTAACPFPTPAHLLKFVAHKKETSINFEAEFAWERALTLRRTEWNIDIPGRFAELFSELPVQEQQACRASGIFCQADMEPEQLHTWAKKRFVETYARWTEHAADVFLLEDGTVKDVLKGSAETLALPAQKREASRGASTQFMTREDLPPVAPKRFEHPPKSAAEQLEELTKHGWLPAGESG
jgi:hypothetical protein